jgi:hypothetical protein
MFLGWDHRSLAKMKPRARSHFRFVLTPEEGVTLDLHSRIIEARVCGSTLHALHNELQRNRYTRMYETIAAYYQDCEHHKLSSSSFFIRGLGSNADYSPLPPILHNPDGYYDHDAPSVQFLSDVRLRYCSAQSELWEAYTQQLTASRVCIDSTFKIAKRMRTSNVKLLWSMMDIETGCILTQQMLTHERHEDVQPMLFQYSERCRA